MTSTMAHTMSMGMPSTMGSPARRPRVKVSIIPMSASHTNRPLNILPPKSGASQSPSAASFTPPMMVLRVVAMDRKMVSPRRM